MDRYSERVQRRLDILTGTKPALYLALGLGVVTGGAVAIVMVIVALSLGAIGGVGTGASAIFTMIGVSVAFWVGASLGIILGVWVGFRAWVALFPRYARAYERRLAAAEQRAAVDEVEQWLKTPPGD